MNIGTSNPVPWWVFILISVLIFPVAIYLEPTGRDKGTGRDRNGSAN